MPEEKEYAFDFDYHIREVGVGDFELTFDQPMAFAAGDSLLLLVVNGEVMNAFANRAGALENYSQHVTAYRYTDRKEQEHGT